MDTQVKQKNSAQLIRQRNGLLFFSLLLALTVFLLSLLLFCKRERIIVVPTSGPAYWIEEQRVSDVYIEKMGLFLSDLLLNRSPADVEQKNRIVLQYIHPASYHDFKRQLLQEQEEILKSGQAHFFRIEKSRADAAHLSFTVQGEANMMIEKDGKEPCLTQRQEREYSLQFRCEGGKLMLESLKRGGRNEEIFPG